MHFQSQPTLPVEEADTLHQKAHTLAQKRRFKQALPIAQQAWQIRNQSLGENHPLTLDSLHMIALSTFRKIESFDEKKLDWESVLPIAQHCFITRSQILGENHPHTLLSMHLYAQCLKRTQKYNDALPVAQDCLQRMKIALGENNIHTLRAQYDLHWCLRLMGQHTLALPLATDSLQKMLIHFPQHPLTLTAEKDVEKYSQAHFPNNNNNN